MNPFRLVKSLVLAAWIVPAASSVAHAICVQRLETPKEAVNHTFTGGANWSFTVSRRQCEGLIIRNAVYTPAGTTTPRMVLAEANIAELHVPYLTNSDRFFDVTETVNGLGNTDPNDQGSDALSMVFPLDSAECSTTKDGGNICVRVHSHGYRWKFGSSFRKAEQVQVFMASQVGNYTYINRWDFNDDGSINVRLGLTGVLALKEGEPTLAPLWGQVITPPGAIEKIAVAHMHNVYYRLDFDIGGPTNDLVSRRSFATSSSASPDGGCGTGGQCGKISLSPVTSETKQTWSPSSQHTWVITDKVIEHSEGRRIGYELLPRMTGLWRGMTAVGESEPWAGHELWVTRFNRCERLAAKNEISYLPQESDAEGGCASPPTGTALDLNEMVTPNPQSVDGQDLVVWYANRVLHYPRDEDDRPMPVEWVGFDLNPRNIHITNPSPAPTP